MPKEIFDVDEFLEIASSRANYCLVKRQEDSVKLKLRTPKTLYTLKVPPKDAEKIMGKLEIEVEEL